MLSKIDTIVALIIGELSAWLLIVIARSLGITNSAIWGLPIVFPLLCLAGLYVAALIAAKVAVIYQIAKFILIGGFNTLVDWGILAFGIFIFYQSFRINANDILITVLSFSIAYYSLFKAISFVLAATNSYFWNKFWTFKRVDIDETAVATSSKEFGQFFLVTFIGFLINVFIASGVFGYIPPFDGLNMNQWAIVAAAFATVVSMVWNFLGYKFIVFSEKPTVAKLANIQ
ncbi:MAG: GtrA family protein [Candidatus Portnoybacteria bacterium]|nr:GtrA family protein [Candidatus Portnoybacteria bacterium]